MDIHRQHSQRYHVYTVFYCDNPGNSGHKQKEKE